MPGKDMDTDAGRPEPFQFTQPPMSGRKEMMAMTNPLFKRLVHFLHRKHGPGLDLDDHEIGFLRLIEGKHANDQAPLSWWCAFNNVDGDKIIKKLRGRGYITLSDYRYNVGKSTVPVLKSVLKAHHFHTKGKKADLVERVLANISGCDCSRHFTQSYYVYTQKALDALREANIRAEEEYNIRIDLIRRGDYAKLKAKLYPNRSEHWGTEDTFFDTLDFIMRHGFEGFGLSENTRQDISAFMALRAIDYSSRDCSTYKNDIFRYLTSAGIDYRTLRVHDSLLSYAAKNEIEDHDEIYGIYCQFIIDRARSTAELNEYRRLGVKKIKVDTVACQECGLSKHGKTYPINKAPILPSCWNCRCIYTC